MSQQNNPKTLLCLPDEVFEYLFKFMMSHEILFFVTQNRRFLHLHENKKLLYNQVTTASPELFKKILELGFRDYDPRLVIACSVGNENKELAKMLDDQNKFEIPCDEGDFLEARYYNDDTTDFSIMLDSLTMACYCGKVLTAKWLVKEKGFVPSTYSLKGAISSGNLELVKWLVEEFEMKIGEYILCCAAKRGDIPMFAYLLSKNTEPDIDFEHFITWVYKSKNKEMIEFYLQRFPLNEYEYDCSEIVVHGTVELVVWAHDVLRFPWGNSIWKEVTQYGSREMIELAFNRSDIPEFKLGCESYLLGRGYIDHFCIAIDRLFFVQPMTQGLGSIMSTYHSALIRSLEIQNIMKEVHFILPKSVKHGWDEIFKPENIEYYEDRIRQYINHESIQRLVFDTLLAEYLIYINANVTVYKDIIDWIVNFCNTIYSDLVCDFYIMINDCKMVKKMLDKGAPVTETSLSRAVYIENYDVMALLRQRDCPMSGLNYCYASCDLQRIMWLYDQGCPLDQRAYIIIPFSYKVDGIRKSNDIPKEAILNCYNWLLEHECPLNGIHGEKVLKSIINWGSTEILDLIYQKGFTFDTALLVENKEKLIKKELYNWFVIHEFILQ